MYKYLAISGGGIKGFTLLGSLNVLEKMGMLDNVEEYVGSSIGGILATFLSIGITVKDMRIIAFDIEPMKFVDVNFIDALNNLGLEDGKRIYKLIRSVIKLKISPDTTFIDHYKKTGKFLTLTGSCLNDKQVYYFNKNTYPNMKLVDAIRITMSYPVVFTPVKFEGKLFIDGAFLAPNPACYYQNVRKLESDEWNKLLVLFSNNKNYHHNTDDMLNNPITYMTAIYTTLNNSYINSFNKEFIDKKRLIMFRNDKFGMDFDVDDGAKFKLYLVGCKTTFEYICGYDDNCDGGCELKRYKLYKAFNKWKEM